MLPPLGGCIIRGEIIRVGEASNPGPTIILPRWQPDPDHTANFAVFGEGWVAFVFAGSIVSYGFFHPFQAKAPREGRPAIFVIAGDGHLFSNFQEGQAYVCAEARPILLHWEGAHEFHVGHQGFGTAVIKVRMAPSGLVWRTGDPKDAQAPWTHADLACGIGGFTVAAQSFGSSAIWACDIFREATQAYNAAQAHALATPARRQPIELRSQWAQHVGTDLILAGFPLPGF